MAVVRALLIIVACTISEPVLHAQQVSPSLVNFDIGDAVSELIQFVKELRSQAKHKERVWIQESGFRIAKNLSILAGIKKRHAYNLSLIADQALSRGSALALRNDIWEMSQLLREIQQDMNELSPRWATKRTRLVTRMASVLTGKEESLERAYYIVEQLRFSEGGAGQPIDINVHNTEAIRCLEQQYREEAFRLQSLAEELSNQLE